MSEPMGSSELKQETEFEETIYGGVPKHPTEFKKHDVKVKRRKKDGTDQPRGSQMPDQAR